MYVVYVCSVCTYVHSVCACVVCMCGGYIVCLFVHVFLHVCTCIIQVVCSILDMFPPLSQVVQVNHMFTQKIEELSDSANSTKDRLQLFIQWWVEYTSNYDKLCPWLKGVESQLEQLVAREESIQSPPVSPVELLQDAKVGV